MHDDTLEPLRRKRAMQRRMPGWMIACGCLLAGGAATAAEPIGESPPAPIWKAAAPPRIDGVLDEPAWRQAAAIPVHFIHGKVSQRAAEPTATARYTWDDDYLYIGYETCDRNLVALGSDACEGPEGNKRQGLEHAHKTVPVDVMEFFVSCDDPNFFWEIHHNAANQFNDIWITVPAREWPLARSSRATSGILFGFAEVLADDVPAGRRLAMAARPKADAEGRPSSVNDDRDADTGYTAELRLPWAGLGVPTSLQTWVEVESREPPGGKVRVRGPWKMAGSELRILAAFQDGDRADRYHHSSPTLPGDFFHKGWSNWPRYRLESDPAAAAGR